MGIDSKPQILLVEDKRSHAVLIQRTLENSGHRGRVINVESLAEAREYLSKAAPDLIICDFLLPDGSGEELLPGSIETAEFPVILMTSHGDEKVAVLALKSGAADYIVKNDRTIAEMPTRIERVLREWNLRMRTRKADRALHENERFMSSIFDAILDGMCVLDENLKIVKANSWLESIVPEKAPLEGLSCNDAFCTDTPCGACAAVLTTGLPSSFELLLGDKQGGSRCFDVSAFPLRGNAGTTEGVILHFKDITHHKEDEERNNILEAQLHQAQKLESIGELAGGIAHDFNNLLTTIIGNSELALLDLSTGQLGYTEMQEINATAQRAAQLTKQLLAFSRRQAAEPQEVDLHQVFSSTERFLTRLIGETITLESRISEPLWNLWIDPTQLDQVLTNLLVNARDAMPDGGTIRLSAKNLRIEQESGKAQSGIAAGEYIRIEVTDNGTGMSDELKQRIFEPFFTTKERGKGSGLGLATCYGIIRQNRGAIEVESIPGKGTSFIVYLPRNPDAPRKKPADTLASEPTPGTEKILVVEDESAIRTMMIRMLESAGYEVVAAESGEAALELLRGESGLGVALIISDVIMPGIDGNTMAEEARKVIDGVRVLFITGYSEDILGDRGIINTEINFVQKPFTRDHLLTVVREIFDMTE